MRDAVNLLLLSALFAVVITVAWVGHIGSDDQLYLNFVDQWLSEGAVVGDKHWANRLTLILPLTAVVGLFGSSELGSVLVTTVYFILLLLLSYGFTRRYFDGPTALVGTALLLTTPLFAVQSTITSVDTPEALFCAAALWLFIAARKSPALKTLLFLAGVAVGLALMTRLTSGGLPIFFALLWLFGRVHPRPLYFYMAAGCGVVVAADALYHLMMAGDPLHRYLTALRSHGGVGGISGDFASGSGNVSDNRIVAPILALLVNQEFGFLYFLTLPAAWVCWRSKTLTPMQRETVRLFILFSAFWFLWIGYAGAIRPLPRYFAPMTYTSVIIVTIFLVTILPARTRLLAALFGLALVGGNALCILVENREPLFGERAMVAFAAGTDEDIYTDPRTERKARKLLLWAGDGLQQRVHATPPPANSVYFYNQKNAQTGEAYGGAGFDVDLYTPREDWTVIARIEPRPRLIGQLLSLLYADRFLPPWIFRRIAFPNPAAVVYRVPAS